MKSLFYIAVFLSVTGSIVFSAEDEAKPYYQSALSFKERAEYARAYTEFSRIPLRFPSSELAVASLYEMGLCALYSDQVVEAGLHFQSVISDHPNSEFAKNALQMNSILYRLHFLPATEKRAYRPQTSYSALVPDLDRPSGVAVDAQKLVYLSDKDKKLVSVFDPAGKLNSTITADSPYSVSVSPDGKIVVANDASILSPGEPAFALTIWDPKNPEKRKPLEDIRSVAVTHSGQYLVASRKESGILRFDSSRKWLPNQTIAPTLEFSKVLVDSMDRVYGLDKDQKLLVAFSPDGKALRTIQKVPGRMEFGKIEDFAVDNANHLYILADDPNSVLIFSSSGELLKQIHSEKKTPMTFEDGKSIAVDASGFIYIVDKDEKRILKIG